MLIFKCLIDIFGGELMLSFSVDPKINYKLSKLYLSLSVLLLAVSIALRVFWSSFDFFYLALVVVAYCAIALLFALGGLELSFEQALKAYSRSWVLLIIFIKIFEIAFANTVAKQLAEQKIDHTLVFLVAFLAAYLFVLLMYFRRSKLAWKLAAKEYQRLRDENARLQTEIAKLQAK